MTKHRDQAEEPWLLDESTPPVFATVRLVDVQRTQSRQDTAWHPELAAGMKCPQCRERDLKRHHSTVYCEFCKQRWWCKRPI